MIHRIAPHPTATEPELAVAATKPLTTAKTTSPMTSSATAAPRMMRASLVFALPKSLSTRAVIPTLVAVRVPPTNK
jgi:hypothetical protein